MGQMLIEDVSSITPETTAEQLQDLGLFAILGKNVVLAGVVSQEALRREVDLNELRRDPKLWSFYEAIGGLTARYVERVEKGELEAH